MHNRNPKEEAEVKSYIFRVIVAQDTAPDGTRAFHTSCPALKGCHTWGHTEEEALANLREAIELYVDDLREAGEPVPVDPAQGALEWPTPAVVVNV
jgi:predicted RNase H-like HicB family nuclease